MDRLEAESEERKRWELHYDEKRLAMFSFNILCDLAQKVMKHRGFKGDSGGNSAAHSTGRFNEIGKHLSQATFMAQFDLAPKYYDAFVDIQSVRSYAMALSFDIN